jgi:ribulose-bisphosphate carboxylase large chain
VSAVSPAGPGSAARPDFTAGVIPYREKYWDPAYEPRATDLLCAFRVQPSPGVDLIEAAAAVAAESSTGTWTEVWSNALTDVEKYKARCYRLDGDLAYIAYPIDLFEEGSIVTMASIVGNVFGFKAFSALRLEDMRIPFALVKSFPGPPTGVVNERARLKLYDRPLLGGTVEPKLGLAPKDYARVAYECLVGGLDITKDDENLHSQPFSRWRDRFAFVMEAVHQAEAETGEAKGHWLNVTAGSTEQVLERVEYAEHLGSRYVMSDYLTLGFAGHQSLVKRAAELGLTVHVHRAMHAVMDRQRNHGIAFLVLAKWLRLAGGDHVHTGTVVGKVEGDKAATVAIANMLREDATRANPAAGIYFDQEWASLKTVFPVASGGIHVHHIPDLYEIYGNDVFWLFGGGTHGHPGGSRAGARANRVATEAVAGGRTLEQAARECRELREAMDLWAGVRFEE